MRFDLFKLQEPEDVNPRTWICVRGKNLNSILRDIINKNCKNSCLEFAKRISNNLNIKHKSIYGNISKIIDKDNSWVSVPLLKHLIDLEGIDRYKIYEKIEFLKVNASPSKPVKAVKELNTAFCKFAGAHAADGHMGKRYRITIIDHYKDNVESYTKWIYDLFGLRLNVEKDKRKKAWLVEYKSKIISRYLRIFFGFPIGRKTYTVLEPEIIKKSSQHFRRAFALGALIFEGCVNIDGRVKLSVKSKNFRDSILEIINNDGLKVIDGLSCKKYTLESKRALTSEERKRWSKYFEEGTTKWKKLIGIGNLKLVYENQILTKILNKISDVKIFDARWLYDELTKEKTKMHFESFRAYLDLLIRHNFIKKRKRIFYDGFSLDSIEKSNVSVLLPYDKAYEMFSDVDFISSKLNIPKSTVYNWRVSYWGIPLLKFIQILKIKKDTINNWKGKMILTAQWGAYLYIINNHSSTGFD